MVASLVREAKAGRAYNAPMRIVMLLLVVFALTGCTGSPKPAPGSNAFEIEASAYTGVFRQAKRVLRDANFTLDRVDARHGIITTKPRPSVGFLTPWLGHHKNFEQSCFGIVNREQRIASVTFMPTGNDGSVDIRFYEGTLTVQIDVHVERIEQPGRRHDASGIMYSSFSSSLQRGRREGIAPTPMRHRVDVDFSRLLRTGLESQTFHLSSRH